MRLSRAASLAFLAAAAAFPQTAPPPKLDAWVSGTMKAFDIPGIAVAIVKDGKPVLTKGYGVRRLGSSEPVDEHTRFGIASNTKAFTAAAVAMLVDAGKLSWDDPVQKHLPAFQLYDPYVTRELTVRDLLCHRSGLGLGAGDLLFWPDTDVTRQQVLEAARHIRPASSLRSGYAYNNLMFVVAGEVVRTVSGQSWDDFVRTRIFAPLRMHETVIGTTVFGSRDNVAARHSKGWRLEGELTPIRPTRDDVWAAAAGINTSAIDITKWLIAQLAGGKLGGEKRLWSEASGLEMWSAQTVLRRSTPRVEALKTVQPNFSAYGLGWSLRDYRGRKIVSHGGGLTGMVTTVVMVPELGLGLAIFTNQEEGGALSALTNYIVDHYLGAPETDWVAAFVELRKKMHEQADAEEKKLRDSRVAGSKPSLSLAKYAGEYRDAWYGDARITQENGRLLLHMTRTPAMSGELEHWSHDTFLARWNDKTIPDALVTFALNYRGEIDRMTMVALSNLADFSFDYHDLLFRPVRKEQKK